MGETFPERLKRLRHVAGKTQKQIADACGKSRPWVTQLETAARWEGKLPPGDDLLLLADALGVTLDELIGRTPPIRAVTATEVPGVPAMRVIPGPWFDIAEGMSRDEDFAATGEQIVEIRRTQTPKVAAEAEAALLDAMRGNAKMWRKVWRLGIQAGMERAAIEGEIPAIEDVEHEEVARDDGE